ncbi:hypothetical protein AAF712_012900 [Marasmius tenuissimus]|uniref:Uncharacterized protein n=1 Tax=Marasmius tenuissimus TaxID=585030 RepID=A0ABR2ZGM5_9AGAR
MAGSSDHSKAELESPVERESISNRTGKNEGLRISDDDLAVFHEREAGRVIFDPEEARIELGEEFTSRLKLTKDGKTILWPQPRDDPSDPQNWSSRKKALHLAIITLATVVPDFDSAIGIATVFQLAEEYHTNTGHINNLTSKYVETPTLAIYTHSIDPAMSQAGVFS